MRYTKIGYIHQNFWHGILVCFIVVCPFLATANQHDTQPNIQETPHGQNLHPSQVTRQDIRDVTAMLIEQQETLTAHSTISRIIFGILLFVILIFFIWLFFQYRILAHELDDVKHLVGISANVNSSLKQDLSDIRNRIQTFAKTSDIEKLVTENQNSTRKILNLLKPIAAKTINEASLPSQEKLESFEQVANRASDLKLPPAIADLCERYNAGIQDKKKQNDFLQSYHSPYNIYVENAMDRRVKQQIKPIFKTHHAAGNFLGCYVEEEKLYAVVPAYRLRIEHTILHYGAFVDVFECHEHELELDDLNSCYEVVKIIRPAIFEPDDAKEIWTFKKRGVLELRKT